MDIKRVKETLEDLRREKQLIDQAISGLEKLLVVSVSDDGNHWIGDVQIISGVQEIVIGRNDSYVDAAVKIIEANDGHPMHIKSIVEHIRRVRNNPKIKRQSVEATFHRHIATKGEQSRIVKMSPAIYGIRRFPREEAAN